MPKENRISALETLAIFQNYGYQKIKGNSRRITIFNPSHSNRPFKLNNDTGIELPNSRDKFDIKSIIKNYS